MERMLHFVPAMDAEIACAQLAKSHYENFPVASWLLPRHLRQHFFNVYAFCREADDRADELGSAQDSLAALADWREELRLCFSGAPKHPIFVALRGTVKQFDLPIDPFEALIAAFERDQRRQRWDSFEALLSYCEGSANPVGRIVLMLFGYRDEERFRLADATCTALQLTNFWQDIAIDLGKGRIYLPQEDLRRFGVSEEDLREARCDGKFQNLMRFEITRTRELFAKGRALIPTVERRLRVDLELFSSGGEAILGKIERRNYDVFRRRPTLSQGAKAWLFLRALLG